MAIYIAMVFALCLIMFIGGYTIGYRDCAEYVRSEIDDIIYDAVHGDKEEDQT